MISGFEFAHEMYTDPRQSGELLLWQFLRLGLIADQNTKAIRSLPVLHGIRTQNAPKRTVRVRDLW